MSINRVIISGNLTRDPELSATQSGMQVLRMGIAVNDRRKNQTTGEWEDYPNFIDCTMFGARAEALSRYLSKGTKVAIEGKLRWSQWERDGQKRSKLEVVVDEIVLMTSREQKPAQAPQQQPPQYPPMQQQAPAYVPPQQGYAVPTPQVAPQPPFVATAQAAPQTDPSLYDEDIPF